MLRDKPETGYKMVCWSIPTSRRGPVFWDLVYYCPRLESRLKGRFLLLGLGIGKHLGAS